MVVVSVVWPALPATDWLLASCSRWSRSFSRWSANMSERWHQQRGGVVGMVPATPGVLQLLLAHNWLMGRMMSLALQSQGGNRGPRTHPPASLWLDIPTSAPHIATTTTLTPAGVTIHEYLACAGAAPAWHFESAVAPQSLLSDPAAKGEAIISLLPSA